MKIANRNIFIDFDGTLVDIAPRHYRVYKKCVEKWAAHLLIGRNIGN